MNHVYTINHELRGKSYYISVKYNAVNTINTPHRYVIVFTSSEYERILPIPQTAPGEYSYIFSLKDIFLFAHKGENVIVQIKDASVIPSVPLDFSDSFSMPVEVKPLSTFGKKFRLVVGTLLLPAFFVHGVLACAGICRLRPEAKYRSGIKKLAYHVNALLRSFSGTGYSKRDRNILFLESEYRKFCKEQQAENILFISERAGSLGDNFDEIYPILKPNYRIILRIPMPLIKDLTKPELTSYARDLASAKVIVLNEFVPELNAFLLRRETNLVQLWHACGAFKLFGYSHFGRKGGVLLSDYSHRTYDYAYVSSEAIVPLYAEAFGISSSHVLPYGVPRTDRFFSTDYQDSIKRKLYERYPELAPFVKADGTNEKPFVVLFAPTFRGDGISDANYPLNSINFIRLLEVLPANARIIVKMHPFVHEKLSISDSCILELPNENINDLLFISDLLITDYSSVIFEASLLQVPMVFYAFDCDKYTAGRDFYFPYRSFIPGTLCENFDELCDALKYKKYSSGKTEEFSRLFFSQQDGKSAERVAAHIIELMEK
ncbi:MAG: CDP-glycerol glycerophosphotransferase family protein [Lachnospiraceae bacterium]